MKYLYNKQVLVLVADGARARLCTIDPRTYRLVETETLVNPEVRLPSRETQSDRPGRTFDSRGDARHALVMPTERKTKTINIFADEIAARVRSFISERDIKNIALIAAPKLLGALRQKLNPSNRGLIVCEINKDFSASDIATIERAVTKKMRGF